MYLTPKQKRKNTLTIVILALGIPFTVFAAWQAVQLISNASAEPVPQDIIISNVSTNSVSIGWVTDVASDGAVVSIKSGSDSSPVIDKRGATKRKNHYVELTDLEPNSDYTFAVISGGERYEESEGKSFSFVTAPISSSVPAPNPVYGDGGSFSKDDFIVYIIDKSQSSLPTSVIPNASGGWAADLSGLRKGDDLSMISVADSDELDLIVISGVDEGDVVSGTFTELFDSKGQLRSVYSLTPELNASIMGLFTSFDATPTDTTVDVVVDTTTDEVPDDDRKFSIIHDLEWVDLVGAGGGLDVVTGEDSVLITNLRDTGFDVVWLSDELEEGYVMYGESSESLTIEAKDIRDSLTVKDSYYTHYIEVDDLTPETKYYFTISSGTSTYDGFDATTFETLASAPPIGSISGDITNSTEDDGAIIVGRMVDGDSDGTSGNSQYASTMSDSRGGWILSIADVRNADGSSYYSYTDGDTIELDVVSYAESTTQEESMTDIESRDIELEVSVSDSSIGYTKVPLLDDYSVLGVQIFKRVSNNTPVEDIENVQDVLGVESDTVPNTGVLDSVFGRISLGIGCFVLGLGIWKSVGKKKKFKGINI